MCLRYVPDKLRAISEIHRVTKKHGIGIADLAAINEGWPDTGIDPDIETIFNFLHNRNQLKLDKLKIPQRNNDDMTCYRITIQKRFQKLFDIPQLNNQPEYDILSNVVKAVYCRDFIW